MTLTRQVTCTTLAGLAIVFHGATQAQAQQATQQPAPIVRIAPRSPSKAQTPAPGPVPSTLPARAHTAAPSAGGVPGTTPAARKPRPAVTTAPVPSTSKIASGSVQSTAAAGTQAPRIIVKPSTAGTASNAASGATEQKASPKLSTTGVNRSVIVLDPAHGGADSGARIGDSTLEKNVSLALAFRLRSLLIARGFTVVLTRDSDLTTAPTNPATSLSFDDRAGIANHSRAAACLLLHATGRGTGVHLYGSDLEPAPTEAALLPWLTAQAAWVPASQALERGMAAALGRSHIALVSSTASVRPVDSLTCPALVVELAPETDVPNSVNDAGYQERVAAAITGALVVWQNTVQTPVRVPPSPVLHPPVRHIAPAIPTEEQP